jgi:PAS domain S-box-containing protein
MRPESRFLTFAVLLAVMVWFVDSLVDWLFFYPGDLSDLMFFRIPPHEIYIRSAGTFLLIGIGFVGQHFIRKARLSREQSEQQFLTESEQALSAVFNSVHDAIFLHDETGRIVTVNNRMLAMYGVSRDEAHSMSISEDFSSRDNLLDRLPAMWTDVMNRRDHLFEWLARRPGDGSEFWAEVFLTRIDLPKGPMIVATVRDIDLRKQAEQAVRDSESLLQDIFNAVQDGISVLDKDLRIVRVNQTMEQWYSHAMPLVGKTCHQAYHGSDHICDPCPSIAALETGRRHVAEVPMTTPDRASGWLELISHPMKDEDGRVYGVVEYVRDITERKNFEAEQDRLINELETKNEELEQFAYTVSHDLKSPLITIKGFLGLVDQGIRTGKNEAVLSDLERIKTAAEKMGRLLDELLDLSRVGRLVNPSENTPFEDLVQEAVELVSGQIMEAGVQVEINDNLPSIYGDRQRLVEVVQNLLENAIKFMGDQAEPRIEIGALMGAGHVTYYVADNGQGIDPQHQEKIFGLFDKLDRDTSGTGVGLALVKRIVETHHGWVWVESDGVGRGATFYFMLPVKPAELD